MPAAPIQPASGPASVRPPSPLLELLRIAAPTVATMTSYTLMQFTDKLLVSRIGPEPIYVGAQGNGGLSAWVPISLAMGTLTVINTYVAQNLGAGRPERAPAYAWNGLWISALFWAALLVPYALFLPAIFRATGMDPEQARLGAAYGQILVLGSVLTLWTRAISQFFYGMHRASVVMVAGIAANLLNLPLTCVLVYGAGHAPPEFGLFGRLCHQIAALLHIPAMGVPGSAIGTVIATGLELAIPMAVFLGPRCNALYHTRAAWRWSASHVRDLIRIGWPAGLMFGNEMICWGYFMVYLVSHFGKEHATAGWIAHQYMSLSFMPAVGLSVATTAVVGKYMGMRRPDLAARRAWLALALAMAYMVLCGAAFVLFRADLIRLFIERGTPPAVEARLIALGSTFLIATAAFQAFDAVAMTISGALRGAGDTVVPGLMTVVLSWTVIVGGGTAAVLRLPDLESLGPWIAAAAYITLLSLFLMGRFLTGHWKARRLLDESAPARPATQLGTKPCTQCGYDLLGLPPNAGLCPECGAAV